MDPLSAAAGDPRGIVISVWCSPRAQAGISPGLADEFDKHWLSKKCGGLGQIAFQFTKQYFHAHAFNTI